MRRLKLSALIVPLLMASMAQAHVRQRNFVQSDSSDNGGKESILHWDFSTPVRIQMDAYSGNLGKVTGSTNTTTSIDESQARSILGASIQKWLASFNGLSNAISVDLNAGVPYTSGTSCEIQSDGNIDGINNIIFTSKIADSTCAKPLTFNSGTVGVTSAKYSQTSGQIVEADIQFDDISFQFLTTGSNNLSSTPKKINLNDVAVHELGHFFGLDHSSVREATMLFAVADNLQTPKSDDMMGLYALYPSGSSKGVGSLKGSLTSDGSPVFGAVVYLLNARTLEIEQSDMTDNNGAFEFCSVAEGPHLAFAGAYKPFGLNIHAYYSGDGTGESSTYNTGKDSADVDSKKCYNPGCTLMTRTLANTWLSKAPTGTTAQGGLALQVFQVSGGTINAYLNMASDTSNTTLNDVPSTTTGTSLTLDEPRVARLSQSTLGLANSSTNIGTDRYLVTSSSSGSLAIKTNSLGIFSRVLLGLKIFAANGTTEITSGCDGVSGAVVGTVGNLGATDPSLTCTSNISPSTDYVIEVTGTTTSCKNIPGNATLCETNGEDTSTDAPLYIITAYDPNSSLTAIDSPFSSATKASSTWQNLPSCGEKSLAVTNGGGDEVKSGGCCGSLNSRAPRAPNGPLSFVLGLLLSPFNWFAAAWFARLAALKVLRKR